MKRILFVLGVVFIYYLLVCFIAGTFNLIVLDTFPKFCIVMLSIPILGLTISGISEDKSFDPVPREEKVKGIKKYIGDLHEELKLYGEAMELQRKINEFKRNK